MIMKYDISDYRVTTRVALGDRIKVFLESTHDLTDTRVLELDGVVGYFDLAQKADPVAWLRINDNGRSTNNYDLSLRLRRPENVDYPEVFIFRDQGCVDFVFRAVAESVDFRRAEKRDRWMEGGW
jgi:hypothetical protein